MTPTVAASPPTGGSPSATVDPDTPTPFPEDPPRPTVIYERVEVEVPIYIRCVVRTVNARLTNQLAAEAGIIVCP